MRKQTWSGGMQPAPAFQENDYCQYTNSADSRQPFCELHGVHLVHRLPPRCPMRTANPLETIDRIRAIAWNAIGESYNPEMGEALEAYEQTTTCMSCLDRILMHATVRRLRASSECAA